MASEHRPWCEACPWRDLPAMRAGGYQYAIDYAAKDPDGFVCHTRLGPCDGPRIARVAPLRALTPQPDPATVDTQPVTQEDHDARGR